MASKYFSNNKRIAKKRKSSHKDNGNDASPTDIKLGKQIAVDSACATASSQSPIKTEVHEYAKGKSSVLERTFFDVPCAELARSLLGQHIVRQVGKEKIKGRIVETEAYQGPEDKAAHSYQGKKTPKNTAMFMTPGTCYVYNIYGIYCCMNISSQGDGTAVLIRALEPVEGQRLMQEGRTNKSGENKKQLKDKDLTNGPSKLCQAFHITKSDFDQVDLTTSNSLWLEKGDDVNDDSVIKCPRINIGYAEDWIDKPLRFYIQGNKSVSVKDKKAELEMKATETKVK